MSQKTKKAGKNTFFHIWALFRRNAICEFRGSGKGAPGGSKSVPSRLYMNSDSKKRVFFTISLRLHFRREMWKTGGGAGPGPAPAQNGLRNRKRCHRVFHFFAR